jgi:hypothetical protein
MSEEKFYQTTQPHSTFPGCCHEKLRTHILTFKFTLTVKNSVTTATTAATKLSHCGALAQDLPHLISYLLLPLIIFTKGNINHIRFISRHFVMRNTDMYSHDGYTAERSIITCNTHRTHLTQTIMITKSKIKQKYIVKKYLKRVFCHI